MADRSAKRARTRSPAACAAPPFPPGLLIADLVGEPATRTSIGALHADIADLRARLEETEASAQTLPHRRKYLLLVSTFLRQLLDLHLKFIEEVEHELAPSRTRTSRTAR